MSQEKTFFIGQRLIVDHGFKSRRKLLSFASVWVSAMGIVGDVGEHGLFEAGGTLHDLQPLLGHATSVPRNQG